MFGLDALRIRWPPVPPPEPCEAARERELLSSLKDAAAKATKEASKVASSVASQAMDALQEDDPDFVDTGEDGVTAGRGAGGGVDTEDGGSSAAKDSLMVLKEVGLCVCACLRVYVQLYLPRSGSSTHSMVCFPPVAPTMQK